MYFRMIFEGGKSEGKAYSNVIRRDFVFREVRVAQCVVDVDSFTGIDFEHSL